MTALRVLILAYDGVEALDFAGPFEVFTTASRVSQRMQPGTAAPFEVASVALTPPGRPVQARAGLQLLADHTIESNPVADVLIVPGGVVDAPMASPETLRWIADCAAGAQLVASVCTGVFLLAKSGVVTQEAVTTHWEDIADLRAQFPKLDVRDDVRWVDTGRIVSSAGISAGIDMSLHLVERLAGRALAERTARQMDYAWTHNSSHPSA
ncbi:transcriptional regulator GlxA family with amidase domain [Variovorax boronicumulans]|uniref:DJ-1/PfpI family protein n=1 Tax=Variovorax boronicumulans TaxID=436515 RepID=UPI0027849A36|nr:DJ-1/PfpI family protein [Variovorax boronicumulans]MDP9990868.1 transcriptional regulator GlxA family with amidase domain [Variovorax boronicumulans]MDQ0002896.1 transcriptional regulator GlxA family with amidase domain [Variovorax boronicumulans]